MKLSIVTPSYNQAPHLEQTLLSVLSQEDPNLEYVVVDGGSTDGSRLLIEKYADRLAYWCSEKDAGQYDAINKGFGKTSGEIMAWLNSSDLYLPWTFSTVREIFTRFPEVQWVTSLRKLCIQEDGSFEGLQKMPGFAGRSYFLGRHGGPDNSDFLQQETVFWRRELWEKIGGRIPDECRFAADFHLWSEFFRHAPVVGVDAPLAAFRFHGDSRSTANRYQEEVDALVEKWKREGTHKTIQPGYTTVIRHWENGSASWRLRTHGGEEMLWITRALEDTVSAILWKLCGLFYLVLKPVLFAVRTLLWPWRKKAPWEYR